MLFTRERLIIVQNIHTDTVEEEEEDNYDDDNDNDDVNNNYLW